MLTKELQRANMIINSNELNNSYGLKGVKQDENLFERY